MDATYFTLHNTHVAPGAINDRQTTTRHTNTRNTGDLACPGDNKKISADATHGGATAPINFLNIILCTFQLPSMSRHF